MNSKSVLDDKNGIPVLRRKTSLPIKLDEGNATIRGLSHTLSIKYKQRSDLATGLCLFTMVLNFY